MNRRFFLGALLSTLASPAIARPGTALELTNAMDETLFFRWTGDSDTDLQKRFDHHCRDRRQNYTGEMDPSLLLMLAGMAARSGEGRYHILSGYRTRATNNILPGAAHNSFHLRGKALDITSPDLPVSEIYQTANLIVPGGLGYYPHDYFIHIDTGPQRSWSPSGRMLLRGVPGNPLLPEFEGTATAGQAAPSPLRNLGPMDLSNPFSLMEEPAKSPFIISF